jgi:tRNA (cmo5U34)-methyltransferase
MEHAMSKTMPSFSDPEVISNYAERTARIVPGLHDLHRMTGVLLAERAPADASVLILGAGGGLELEALVEMQPEWRFDGVDPSAEMLQLARSTLGELSTRVTFHEGTIDSAPDGPFDAATCLLTLHFLEKAERRRTVREVSRRLKPGAPFVVAHHSFPNRDSDKDKWLIRNAAFAAASGVPASHAENNIKIMKERLPVLSPDQDEAILRKSGFSGVELFYAAFTFRGWVGYRT